MNISETCIFMNAFFISQFSYCLLLWMCSSCINNKKVNSLRKPCLQIIYQDKKLSPEQLLINDKSVSVHQRNLQCLSTEMYKISKGLFPILTQLLLVPYDEHTYSLRYLRQFKTPSVNTVYHGT